MIARRSLNRRTHAREQLDLLEGLGNEVVGAGVERLDHVLARRVGGDDDHRQGRSQRIGAQPPANLEAVEARQVEVEQHQVGLMLDDRAQPVLAVANADRLVGGRLEHAQQHLALSLVVLDDQHERDTAQRPQIAHSDPSSNPPAPDCPPSPKHRTGSLRARAGTSAEYTGRSRAKESRLRTPPTKRSRVEARLNSAEHYTAASRS